MCECVRLCAVPVCSHPQLPHEPSPAEPCACIPLPAILQDITADLRSGKYDAVEANSSEVLNQLAVTKAAYDQVQVRAGQFKSYEELFGKMVGVGWWPLGSLLWKWWACTGSSKATRSCLGKWWVCATCCHQQEDSTVTSICWGCWQHGAGMRAYRQLALATKAHTHCPAGALCRSAVSEALLMSEIAA